MSSNTVEVYSNIESNQNGGSHSSISVHDDEHNYFNITTADSHITLTMNDEEVRIPRHLWEVMEAARTHLVEVERPDLFTPRPALETNSLRVEMINSMRLTYELPEQYNHNGELIDYGHKIQSDQSSTTSTSISDHNDEYYMDRILLTFAEHRQEMDTPDPLVLENIAEVTTENNIMEDWLEFPMPPSLFSPSWSRRPLQDITNSFNRQDLN